MPPAEHPKHDANDSTGRARRFLERILDLRAANAFDPREVAPGSGVYRWRFRAGGWPVDVMLDRSVLELRIYHDREEVAMGRVPERAMDALLGREPAAAASAPPAEATLAELRRLVAEWKAGNPRIFMQPPVKVGHPDNWNEA